MQTENNTYWAGNGTHQALYDGLYKDIVPVSGSCETLGGELLRASSRIYHDYFNNGFGNNWSGAREFLSKFANNELSDESRAFLDHLSEWAQGQILGDGSEAFEAALEKLTDEIIVLADKMKTAPNIGGDLFEYQLPDDWGHDEEEEDEFDDEYGDRWDAEEDY